MPGDASDDEFHSRDTSEAFPSQFLRSLNIMTLVEAQIQALARSEYLQGRGYSFPFLGVEVLG